MRYLFSVRVAILFGSLLVSVGLLTGCEQKPSPASSLDQLAEESATHPDLNGVWAPLVENFFDTRSVTWAPLSAGKPEERKPPSQEEVKKMFAGLGSGGNIFVLGAGMVKAPAMTPEGEKALEALKPRMSKPIDENSWRNCEPKNRTGVAASSFLQTDASEVQIVQSKDAIVLFGPMHPRIIYTDGRSFERAALPSYSGYSIGHWEGDTLVVETRLFKGDSLGGQYAPRLLPMSQDAKITEYFKLTNNGKTLTIKAIFEDPRYYTEPMGKMVYLDRAPDVDIIETECLEGLDEAIDYNAAKG